MARKIEDLPFYPQAVKMLGPREHWPSIADHVYAGLVEQFNDAATDVWYLAIKAASRKAEQIGRMEQEARFKNMAENISGLIATIEPPARRKRRKKAIHGATT